MRQVQNAELAWCPASGELMPLLWCAGNMLTLSQPANPDSQGAGMSPWR